MHKREKYIALVGMLPLLVIFIAFTYLPLVVSAYYSLTDWNGINKVINFVGFSNYITLFKNKDFYTSFLNTFRFALESLLVCTPIQFLLALFLHKKFAAKNAFRAIIYAPVVISSLVSAFIWMDFFQNTGIINQFLHNIGADWLAVDWLGSTHAAMNTLVFINAWAGIGWGMVILLAGLSNIPEELLEACKIDGASAVREFFSVKLPLLMPSITVLLFAGITSLLQVFVLPFIMTNGGPINATRVVGLDIYNYAFKYHNFGLASALGLINFVVIAIFSFSQVRFTRKREVEG